MKLPKLTQKIASIFRELTRTGTARGPGAVGQNSRPMGPPETSTNDSPLSPGGVPSPSAPCNDTAIQGYYACGHDGAKRITQQDGIVRWYLGGDGRYRLRFGDETTIVVNGVRPGPQR